MGEVGDSERAAYASTFGPFPAGRSSVSLVDFPRSQPLILRARALQLLLTPIFSIHPHPHCIYLAALYACPTPYD